MPHRRGRQPFDYEPVTPSPRRPGLWAGEAAAVGEWSQPAKFDDAVEVPQSIKQESVAASAEPRATRENWIIRRGHALSYAGLFLFTVVLYFRPYELIPSLSSLSTMAFWIAILTLLAFIPAQLSLEGNVTARPREVNLLLLLCCAAISSIPLAINPSEAYGAFSEYIRPVVIFIVIINVVRTEARLRILIWLSLAVSIVVSLGVISDFRTGHLEDNRVWGSIGNLFGNPNDLALHLATMVPLAVALLFSSRGIIKKAPYAISVGLMMVAIVLTFSRGGFLGLIGASAVLAWKLGRRNRLAIVMVVSVFIGVFAIAPGSYMSRLSTIFDASKDVTGSSAARQALLIRSLEVVSRHPLLGIGMGNFHIVSIHEQASHNAYTQVAAEMGWAALLFYVLFMITPVWRLRRVEQEAFASRRRSPLFYLSVGMQASIVAYMISSFFGSVAYQFYVYYLVGYAVCLRRLFENEISTGQAVAKPASENQIMNKGFSL